MSVTTHYNDATQHVMRSINWKVRSAPGSAIPSPAACWGHFVPETVSSCCDRLHATRRPQRNDEALSVNPWWTCLQQWWVIPFLNSRSISSCTMDGKGDLLFQNISFQASVQTHTCWDPPSVWVLPLFKSHICQSMDQLSSSMQCSSEWSAAVPSDCTVWHSVQTSIRCCKEKAWTSFMVSWAWAYSTVSLFREGFHWSKAEDLWSNAAMRWRLEQSWNQTARQQETGKQRTARVGTCLIHQCTSLSWRGCWITDHESSRLDWQSTIWQSQ